MYAIAGYPDAVHTVQKGRNVPHLTSGQWAPRLRTRTSQRDLVAANLQQVQVPRARERGCTDTSVLRYNK